MNKKLKRNQKINLIDKQKRTILTEVILKNLGFSKNEIFKFPLFENMGYWVKNGVCLFYNMPIQKDYQESFYVGYGEQRQGTYIAVAFRWIDNLEELTQIYESIVVKKITEPI